MSTTIAVDTSVAVPLLVQSHDDHAAVHSWWGSGGAVYDALVALTAKEHGCALATRDARAKATYEAVGADVIAIA